MGVLLEKWSTAVGSGIAAHTRPGRLINKELTIFVDSSPWLSELQRCAKKELLNKLQSVYGRDVIQVIRGYTRASVMDTNPDIGARSDRRHLSACLLGLDSNIRSDQLDHTP